MHLVTFGKLYITNSDLAKTKHLLLLTYLALEGAKKRYEIAEVFWEDMKDQLTAKGERKDLQNLSVTLAQIRKYIGKESIQKGQHKGELQTIIPCDAKNFLTAFNNTNYQKVWSLYQGSFLYDIEHIIKFQVFDTLYLWIMSTRENFAKMAQKALIELAKQALAQKDFEKVGNFAELAYNLPAAPPLEPDALSEINYLLLSGGSRLAAKTSKTVSKFLEESELSKDGLRLFLALSLQEKVDFGVARAALKLSAKSASKALEELILAGLVGGGAEVRATNIAENYLDERPTLRLPLLLDLASATPKEEAFSIYKKIYQLDNTFGGIGFLQKARVTYLLKAWQLARKQEFQKVAQILKDIRAAEVRLDLEPDLEVRFLEAYSLERGANYKEILDLIKDPNVEAVPRLLALKATSLMRLGNQKKAQKLAQVALEKADDSKEGRWARALALQCLGNIAYNIGNSEHAISLWKQAETYWSLLKEKHRQVGILNNIANAMAQAKTPLQDIVDIYNEALELLDKCDNVAVQKSNILINLGFSYSEHKQFDKVEKYYLKALNLLQDEQLLDKALHQVAILHLNLGALYLNHQNIPDIARAASCLKMAITTSLKSGATNCQAISLAELAILKESPELMHTALEILEANNSKPELEIYRQDYEKLLKKQLVDNLSQNRFSVFQHYSKQLLLFYQKQNYSDEKKLSCFLDKVDRAFNTFKLNIEKEIKLSGIV